MGLFSRTDAPSAEEKCRERCKKAKSDDDVLIQAVAERVKSITGNDIKTTGHDPRDEQPMMVAADSSPCRQRALTIAPEVRRFNRYREALPAARAAANMNELGDGGEKDVPLDGDCCLTRLPMNTKQLNEALGLKPDDNGNYPITDLRNNDTGFRAALYRQETDGKILLVARDTQPHSLVDWKTNIDNGMGQDTKQYQAMRTLAGALASHHVPFDVAGYSKGGGLAQQAGLVSPNSKVYVFNSAGLPQQALERAGPKSLESLQKRTMSFSRPGDFLTYMNNTTDPEKQLVNAQFLRDALAGDKAFGRVKITYRNPELKNADQSPESFAGSTATGSTNAGPKDPTFEADRQAFLKSLDAMIKQKRESGDRSPIFPPVRAGSFDTLPEKVSWYAKSFGAEEDKPNFGKLLQHRVGPIPDVMKEQADADRKALASFLKTCG